MPRAPDNPRPRRAIFIVTTVAVLAAAAAWLAWPGDSAGEKSPPLPEIVAALERGAPGAVDQARRAARDRWPACRNDVAAMLSHDHWRVRVAACRILADRGEQAWLDRLLALCNDFDWRVRAAAAEAVGRVRPLPAACSLRDTPLAQRDRLLLDWMDAWAAERGETLAERLAPIYADARHVEFGPPLADRCLACHAGPTPRPAEAGRDCRRCHRDIHRQWSTSAHANSLTHLRLPTVVGGETRIMDFGALRGMDCTACHRIAGRRADAEAADACPYRFAPAPAEGVCVRCHEPTTRQWRSWREARRPRRAVWPPGQIEFAPPAAAPACASCHMPAEGAGELSRPLPAHHWRARRNPALLAGGVAVQVRPRRETPGGAVVRMVLTNLAGHDYPTGAPRRGVQLFAGPAGGDPPPLTATLRPAGAAGVDVRESPLAPGEQRAFDIPAPPDAETIAYRLVYRRDMADPNAFTAEILSGAYDLNPWRGSAR